MMLIHRCRACMHPDYYHSSPPDCSYGGCVCAKPDFDPEPEAAPTFTRDGQLDELFHAPGPFGKSMNDLKQCGCQRCRELLADKGVA